MHPQPTYSSEPPVATLDSSPPAPLERGSGTALVVAGRCRAGCEDLELSFAGALTAPLATGLPVTEPGWSGWRAIVGVAGDAPTGTHALELTATLAGGRRSSELARIELVDAAPPPESPGTGQREPDRGSSGESPGGPLVAICMATWEPDRLRLQRQVDSIRSQAGVRWVCVISDDGSSTAGSEALAEVVGDDQRFFVSRSERRLGFYRNFERALRLAPPEAELVALADQDDHWWPEKLATMVAALAAEPEALLAFSDFRLVAEDGEVLSATYWTARRQRSSDLASMLVANQVTGAASLLRRELADLALPFPPDSGSLYHDHWLALCALAAGGITYVDRPTYDHIRYDDAVTVRAQGRGARELPPSRARRRAAAARRIAFRLRARRLGIGSEAAFDRYLAILQLATVLELRLGDRLSADHRRALRRLRAAPDRLAGAGWLALRSMRPLIGKNETMARERYLLGGLLWRRGAARRRGRGQTS